MKNILRILSVVGVLLLCIGMLVACGTDSGEVSPSTTLTMESIAGSEPFIAPPDALGKVIAVDSSLVTWNTFAINEEVIDFMGVDVEKLDAPNEEAVVVYLEDDISCYLIKDGKLVDITLDEIQPGAVIGITTLEEGVQDIYILYNPAPQKQTDDVTDEEEVVEDFAPESETTAATEEIYIEESEAEEESAPVDGSEG